MVDEESQDVASESTGGAPVSRERRGDPGVIEGEAPRDDGEATPSQEASEPASPAEDAVAAAPPSREAEAAAPTGRARPGVLGAFLSGALGGLVIAAVAGGAGYYYLVAPKSDLAKTNASRLTSIESQAQREDSVIAGLEKRVGALEGTSSASALAAVDKRVGALQSANAGLEKRVGALEGASSTNSPAAVDKRLGALQSANAGLEKRVDALEGASSANSPATVDKRLGALQSANAEEASRIAAATQATQALTGEIKDLRADVAAARGEIPGLQARVAKLESGPPQAVAADLSAVTARIDKIEAKLAAPRKPSAADNPAAVAIIAETLGDKLAGGAPFPTELAGLERLGVEPAKLTALKALVNGAPSDTGLADAFAAVQSKVVAAAAPAEADRGIVDRLEARLRGLIQVRKLNETAGDDPQALAARIEADSRRGDVSGALAAFAKLPEPSRQAASSWASPAEARRAAEAALQSIRETAVAQLAESGKP
jgi:hypothetical protein